MIEMTNEIIKNFLDDYKNNRMKEVEMYFDRFEMYLKSFGYHETGDYVYHLSCFLDAYKNNSKYIAKYVNDIEVEYYHCIENEVRYQKMKKEEAINFFNEQAVCRVMSKVKLKEEDRFTTLEIPPPTELINFRTMLREFIEDYRKGEKLSHYIDSMDLPINKKFLYDNIEKLIFAYREGMAISKYVDQLEEYLNTPTTVHEEPGIAVLNNYSVQRILMISDEMPLLRKMIQVTEEDYPATDEDIEAVQRELAEVANDPLLSIVTGFNDPFVFKPRDMEDIKDYVPTVPYKINKLFNDNFRVILCERNIVWISDVNNTNLMISPCLRDCIYQVSTRDGYLALELLNIIKPSSIRMRTYLKDIINWGEL